MFVTTLAFLLLGYNVIFVISDCPKSQEWRNLKVSPGGPLVCARLYADSKCSGFPLPFGINSSSSDLGTDSSAAIDFERNNVTALVRPGCNMYLWEGVNFTGEHRKSINYTWNINRRHYRSALCNCSVDDLELLQCELREEWELINFCDFRKSDIGGLCSVTLKRSHIGNGSDDARNLTITNNLAHLFVDKIVESFGEERMTSFLDVNSNDKVAHSVFVEARSGIKIKQGEQKKDHSTSSARKIAITQYYDERYFACCYGDLYASNQKKITAKAYQKRQNPRVHRDDTGRDIVPKHDAWIYNQITGTYFWFSSVAKKYSEAREKCKEMGADLAHLLTTNVQNWMKPFFDEHHVHKYIWICGANCSQGEYCTYIINNGLNNNGFHEYWGNSEPLIWQDEFDGTALDTSKWNIITGNLGVNEEHQYYQGDNLEVSGGYLVITARKETKEGQNYTSGRIDGLNKFSTKYGRIEARLKLPMVTGSWPAFWMLGDSFPTAGWPQCGELDIMEHVNTDTTIMGTLHWYNNGQADYGTTTNISTPGAFGTCG
ncbi:glycosyl hydrolases family 16 domain-containing protein [Ditylenchus destructor]|nr:glycosyl hydrolases family 16 domain-containing protein [Ditylenchus destructor]